MTEAVELLARLRATVRDARSVPMSASVVINREDLLGQLDALRTALEAAGARSDEPAPAPTSPDVGTSPELVAERAESQDGDVLDLLEAARRECAELRQQTDEYVDGRLAQLEGTLTRTLEIVSRGRGRLHAADGAHGSSTDHPSVVPGLGFPEGPPASI